jgi:hypothetical protein
MAALAWISQAARLRCDAARRPTSGGQCVPIPPKARANCPAAGAGFRRKRLIFNVGASDARLNVFPHGVMRSCNGFRDLTDPSRK